MPAAGPQTPNAAGAAMVAAGRSETLPIRPLPPGKGEMRSMHGQADPGDCSMPRHSSESRYRAAAWRRRTGSMVLVQRVTLQTAAVAEILPPLRVRGLLILRASPLDIRRVRLKSMVSMGLADTDEGVRPLFLWRWARVRAGRCVDQLRAALTPVPSHREREQCTLDQRHVGKKLPCEPRKGEVGNAQPERMGGTTHGSEVDGAL